MSPEAICIFEDEGWYRLEPLVSTRPVFDLRLGMVTLRERIKTALGPASVVLHCRAELAESVAEDNLGIGVNAVAFDRCLFVNGRVVADKPFKQSLGGTDDCLYRCGEDVVAARVSGSRLEDVKGLLQRPLDESVWEGFPVREVDAKLIRYPWDLVSANPGEIIRDFERMAPSLKPSDSLPDGVRTLHRDAIWVGPGHRLAPGVVLDASDGPVVLGANVDVRANAVIRGPAVIGEGSLIQPLAMIEATTVGPVCKLGGEIRECVIQGYSNKQHSGYLGHAYLGEWVNLGAETTNSDLKNNYSTVGVRIAGKQVDSGKLFVGCFVGDHTKSAIGSRFNTGSVCGVCCLLYAAGFLPKYVPPFTWLGHEGPVKYSLEKALETAEMVMARRGVKLAPTKRALLRTIYERTEEERKG